MRSGNNGLLLGAMQSPSITSASLELALITAMYSCNADSSELLLMAGKVLPVASGSENDYVYNQPGTDARCLNAPDNPPAFLLAAACDGSEMLELVDQCVCCHPFSVQQKYDCGDRYLRKTVATKSPSAKLSDRYVPCCFRSRFILTFNADSGQRL